jgi:threonine dehydrogenase-like Zn-dependent dehydrogenase
MKAVALIPRRPDSLFLGELPVPSIDDVPDGRGVLVKVLRVGLCGTDREMQAGEYGAPPPESDFLVLGHESFGVVEQVGPKVTGLAPGDYVVAAVRRPGNSPYDALGMQDLSTDDEYHEHGINLLHGFFTEYYVDVPEFLMKIPASLRGIGVLTEPMTIVEKGVSQAYEIQRRLRIWNPQRATVLGAGTIGLLATLLLRLRGLEVVTIALEEKPYLNSDLVEAIGARYVSTREASLAEAAVAYGPFDLIFEATGFAPLVFEAMQALGKNGVLVMASVTGGDRLLEVPVDAINQGFVLGNKVAVGTVNARSEHYRAAAQDFALAEAMYLGWLSRLLTHRVRGLDNYQQAFELLNGPEQKIKILIEVASSDQ